MSWLQLFVDTNNSHVTAIEDALLAAGAASVTLKEHIPQGQQEQPILEPGLGETPLWNNTRLVGLFSADVNTQSIDQSIELYLEPLLEQLLERLPESSPKQQSGSLSSSSSLDFRWEQLEDKDWEREWMQNYHPIQCADNLWICPSWITPPNPAATNILLDPGLAFGTGTHPTTFLCLQWLAAQDLQEKEIIDYGCGSGILGVAALLLGAKQAAGVDIDPQALIATQDNLGRNGLSADRFEVHLPTEFPQTISDIVVANILAGPLVELSDKIIMLLKPAGKLCLSGILATQAESVMEAYRHAIDFNPIASKEEWVQLNGVRKMQP